MVKLIPPNTQFIQDDRSIRPFFAAKTIGTSNKRVSQQWLVLLDMKIGEIKHQLPLKNYFDYQGSKHTFEDFQLIESSDPRIKTNLKERKYEQRYQLLQFL